MIEWGHAPRTVVEPSWDSRDRLPGPKFQTRKVESALGAKLGRGGAKVIRTEGTKRVGFRTESGSAIRVSGAARRRRLVLVEPAVLPREERCGQWKILRVSGKLNESGSGFCR